MSNIDRIFARQPADMSNGTPLGKAVAWVSREGAVVFGPFEYDTTDLALHDAPRLFLEVTRNPGTSVVINYKHEDGSRLDVYRLTFEASYERQEPMQWPELFGGIRRLLGR